jgi:ATP-binding cassette, subfamily B, bacterial PglK
MVSFGHIPSLNVISRSLVAFSTKGSKKMLLVSLSNSLLGILDLIAIGLIGVLVSMAINGDESDLTNRIRRLFDPLGSSSWDFSSLISFIAIVTALFFVLKTVLSIKFTRRILHFLSSNAAELSSRLVAKMLTRPITSLETKSSHETLYLLTRGVEVLALQILAIFFILIADVFLVVTIFMLVFLVDPVTATLAALIFGATAFLINYFLNSRASNLGQRNTSLNIDSNEVIMDVFQSYRELVVGSRRPFYVEKLSKIRGNLAYTSAELSFMPFISKFVLEITLILSAILISGAQFILNGSTSAVQTLAVFLAAGARLAPAVLRLQQAVLQIKSSEAMAISTLDLIDELQVEQLPDSQIKPFTFSHDGFNPRIEVRNLTYTYPSKTEPTLKSIDLSIEAGQHVAIVGPSGAGKSTLVDVILGIIHPDSGTVKISGLEPLEAFSNWPGATSYVPQNTFIVTGTVRTNLAFGYDSKEVSEERCLRAIENVSLGGYVASLAQGLDTHLGESGVKMSGGQKQRLGIARALITNPMLLVMDEATSALDGETEELITSAISFFSQDITSVTIAHRLSTVVKADQVIYLADGEIKSVGSFEKVRSEVPDFDNQAKLLGL